MPDINSLPPLRSIPPSPPMARVPNPTEASTLRTQTPSPSLSSRNPPVSLQAAAAVNAGHQQESSRRSSSSSVGRNRRPSNTGRRRSTVLHNIQLNDSTLPPPGEMVDEGNSSTFRTESPQNLGGSPIIGSGDPHHNRAPSLGEIHQEIEQEQEAQVNRLLQMIRTQQQQLQQLQAASGQPESAAPVIDDSTPASELSMSFTQRDPLPPSAISTPRSPSTVLHPRSSFDLARTDVATRRSRTSSRTASPRMGATSTFQEGERMGGRDESAFYQAETQMMVRENQMLRQRIRELERQVNDLHSNASITHEPSLPSNILRSSPVSETPAATTPGEQKDE